MAKSAPIPEFAMQSIGLAFGIVGTLNLELYRIAITPLGISEKQLFILTTLDKLGPQVQAHLSVPLQIDKATMVGLVNDLEQKGFVERRPHPSDRRAVLVHLTEAGRAKMLEGFEMSNKFTKRLFQGVSPEEQQTMQRILRQLVVNATAMQEENEIIE